MTLKSKLFAREQRLEAAATADQAHIVRGASGAHVAKIQSALIELDGALISGRELQHSQYGDSTSRAVLRFKTRRDLVNRSYQTQADDIVGKMTIAALDSEMFAREGVPGRPVTLEPITPKRKVSQISSASILARPTPKLSVVGSVPVQAPRPTFDNDAIDIQVFGVGSFRVVNGIGGILICDPNIAAIFDPLQITAPNFVPVTTSPQVFNVRGLNAGATIITLQKPFVSVLLMPQPIVVIVRSRTKIARVFKEGVQHNHRPSGKWSEVSSNPRNAGAGDNNEGGISDGGIFSGNVLAVVCKGCPTPKCVIDNVIALRFGSLPVAKTHIEFYLRGGGRDFNEDTNIAIWIRSDSGIRSELGLQLNAISNKSGRKPGHFQFSSGHSTIRTFNFHLVLSTESTSSSISIWMNAQSGFRTVMSGIQCIQVCTS